MSIGAVAVETNANICKSRHVESEVEEVDPVESTNFLEIGGYVAKESVNDVAIRDNLSHEQRAEFMDLAKQFQSLFTEAPGTSLAQHHIKPGVGENTLRRLALFVYVDHPTKNDVTSGKKAMRVAKSNFNMV